MLPEYVADTHALFRYFMAMSQLGSNAKAAFDAARDSKAIIIIPSIVIAEMYYVNGKLGKPLDFAQALSDLMNSFQFVFVGLRAEDVLQFDAHIAITEMHDRMIAGVAIARKCPLLTRDASIIASGLVPIVW